MKKIFCLIISAILIFSLTSCSNKEVKEVKITFNDTINGVFGVGSVVSIPIATADNGKDVLTKVISPDGMDVTIVDNSFTATQEGIYIVKYSVNNTERKFNVKVLGSAEIDNCDDEGKIEMWSTIDSEGSLILSENRDLYYVDEGKGSYKISLGNSSSSWPAMEISSTNFLSEDFSAYDELSFSIYNDTQSRQKIFIKLWSDDGIQQVVDSQLNAYGIEAGVWTYFSISFEELGLYNPDFAVTDMVKLRIGIANQDLSEKTFYIDNIGLTIDNDPKVDYSSLEDNETLISGFENKADAFKNEPYSGGITRYVTYNQACEIYPTIARLDSGKGLMYVDKSNGQNVWTVSFESMLRPNSKLLMFMYNPDFSQYKQIKIDIFNTSVSTQVFTLRVASEAMFGWLVRSESVEIAPKSWGTATLSLIEATSPDDMGDDGKGAIETAYIGQIDIMINPASVAKYYLDNLRLVA